MQKKTIKQKDDEEDCLIKDEPQTAPAQPTQPQNDTTISYGEHPISMRCPYCLQHIRSQIILKPEFISIALGISIFSILPNMLMLLLVVTLMHLTSARKHRCPLCERQLGSDGKFLIYLTDEVYSFTLFSSGFIFTKKMLITGLLLTFAIGVISVRATISQQQRLSETTWKEYLGECGNGSDPNACLSTYRGKLFQNWQGYLLRMGDNRQTENRWYMHAISLYVKMEPQIKKNLPDVLLTLSTEALYYNEEVVRELKHGDRVQFNCTLHDKERGNLKDVLHFHIESLAITGHDSQYSLYTTEVEEEWIEVNVENRPSGLRSEEDNHSPSSP